MRVRTELAERFEDRARFHDPTNRYIASFASPWRRTAAAAVDWGLCYIGYVLVSIPLGMLQRVGQISWEAGDFGGTPGHVLFVVAQLLTLTPVIAYWLFLLPTSQTYGMRVTDLRIVAVSTGRGISYVRSAVRAFATTAFGIAFYVVFIAETSFNRDEERLDRWSNRIEDAAYGLAVAGCISAFAMFVTPSRRTLLDRLFGTATLDELEPVEAHMGPWGPVDAFDTSR